MYQNKFIPTVCRLSPVSQEPLSVGQWDERLFFLFNSFVELVGQQKVIVGHIKALAEFENEAFIKYSCIDVKKGLNVERSSADAPPASGITVTLNSIVSGLSHEESFSMLAEAEEIFQKKYPALSLGIEAVQHEEHPHAHGQGDHGHVHHEHHGADCSCGHCHDGSHGGDHH